MSGILSSLASNNYFLESISVKLIYQFLYPSNGYLFFRCLETGIEIEIIEVLQQASDRSKKKDRKVKDWNDKILDFDLVFGG